MVDRNTDFEVNLIRHLSGQDKEATPFVRKTMQGGVLDTRQVVTASEVYKCARALVYEKSGVEDGRAISQNGYMQRGRVMEDWFFHEIKDLPDAGVFAATGKDQVTFVSEPLAGTPDGLEWNGSTIIVYELKTVSSVVLEPLISHKSQLFINMNLIRDWLMDERTDLHEFFKVSKDEVEQPRYITGRLIYVNSSNWHDIVVYDFDYGGWQSDIAKFYREQKSRCSTVVQDVVDFKEEKIISGFEGAETGACKDCPFKDRCIDAAFTSRLYETVTKIKEGKRSVSSRFQDFSSEKDIERARQYFENFMKYRTLANQYNYKKERYRDEAKRYVALNGCEVDYGEDKIVTYSVRITNTYDMDAIKSILASNGIDIDNYKTQKEVEYLMEKVKKKKG